VTYPECQTCSLALQTVSPLLPIISESGSLPHKTVLETPRRISDIDDSSIVMLFGQAVVATEMLPKQTTNPFLPTILVDAQPSVLLRMFA